VADSFELFLLNDGNEEGLVALARRGSDTAIEFLPVDKKLKELSVFARRIGSAISGNGIRPSKTELVDFGVKLFDYLFKGKLRDLYVRLPAGPISLQILSDRPEIREVRWEYLGPPDRIPVPDRERSVIRILPTCGIDMPLPRRIKNKKIKVLFVSADPVDQPGVMWADVLSTIERTFVPQMPAEVTITVAQGATRAKLLNSIVREKFEIFHFFGHGTVDANGMAQLVLEDVDSGASDFISAEDVAIALAGKDVQLAILSACLSGAGRHFDDFGVVATALIMAGIPAVLANQYPIPYKSISPFVGSIYSSLLQFGDIDRAVAEGRAVLSAGISSTVHSADATVEWGIPTLHRLANARQLFKI
jgi:hypothetical protein